METVTNNGTDPPLASDGSTFGITRNMTEVVANYTYHQASRAPEEPVITITIIYIIILLLGILGNVSTCIVIARNRGMHTATNFYLFSLAISDLVLLLSGLPIDLYRVWRPGSYPLGDFGCISLGLASETSTNATVLTIAAFTFERYIAICRPFMSHTMSKLSRAVRFIVGIWMLALCTAVPQALQYGVVQHGRTTVCTVKGQGVQEMFMISSFVFFVVPMSLITVLYALIGMKLRHSSILQPVKKSSLETAERLPKRGFRGTASQRRVIRMLVAVTVSFFLCWAPFHVQRLLAIYGKKIDHPSDTYILVFVVMTHISGVLYFLSTAINPILYNIMSNKFREAFKVTLAAWCGNHRGDRLTRTYSSLMAVRRDRSGTNDLPPKRRVVFRRHSTASTQLEPPRAQRMTPELFMVSEAATPKKWNFPFRLFDCAPASPQSISNSSLREFDEEVTGEELTTFMHQVNIDLGYT